MARVETEVPIKLTRVYTQPSSEIILPKQKPVSDRDTVELMTPRKRVLSILPKIDRSVSALADFDAKYHEEKSI